MKAYFNSRIENIRSKIQSGIEGFLNLKIFF